MSLVRRLMAVSVLALLAVMMSLFAASTVLAKYGAQSKLTAVEGQGAGVFVIAPTAEDHGTFSAEMTVSVQGATPNTTFTASRAPDFNPDGVCEGTNYWPLPEFNFMTLDNGTGAHHFHYELAAFQSGKQFDVLFQFVGADGTVLQSDCMSITVK